jgi:septum site-determining protein MinD
LLDVLRDVNQLEDSIYEVKVRDRTFHSYVHVLPAATSVKGFKEVNIKNFRNVLEKLRNDYDFIILDVAAGLSKYAVVPILSSDAIYLVTNPEKAPILNAQKVRKVADASGVRVEGIILNRYRGEKKMVKYAEGTIGSEVVGIIRESRLIEECWDEGIPAAMKKPNSRVARDFMNLARRIIGEDVSIKPYGKLKFLLG